MLSYSFIHLTNVNYITQISLLHLYVFMSLFNIPAYWSCWPYKWTDQNVTHYYNTNLRINTIIKLIQNSHNALVALTLFSKKKEIVSILFINDSYLTIFLWKGYQISDKGQRNNLAKSVFLTFEIMCYILAQVVTFLYL